MSDHASVTIPGAAIFRRGDPGYAAARDAATWSARDYGRYPDVIVQARTAEHVAAAVRLARAEGWRIGVRSGGHSWNANHVRDGGMLLDVSRLDSVAIDAGRMIAVAGPGVEGTAFDRRLARAGAHFPTGHCRGVKLGGYLLQGGYGWGSRTVGPACESVIGVDYVDAEGRHGFADEAHEPDLFWAARGAGPGFFAVVTAYHLKLRPRPRAIGMQLAAYPASRIEEVVRWVHAVGSSVPGTVELHMILSRHIPAVRGPGLLLFAPVLADSWAAARADSAFMKGRPRGSRLRIPLIPFRQSWMTELVMSHYPDGYQYSADNMWTHAGIDDLMPGIHRILATLPSSPSHMLWFNWAPPPERPDMAYSLEDRTYIALYGVWKDDPAGADAWPQDNMAALQHLSTGIQLSDENLANRPMPFMAPDRLARLDALRARYDPDGRFHEYMGRHDRP